jgi:ribosomal protein L31E
MYYALSQAQYPFPSTLETEGKSINDVVQHFLWKFRGVNLRNVNGAPAPKTASRPIKLLKSSLARSTSVEA